MIKKILLILMMIVVTMPSMVIDLTSLRVSAAEVASNHVSPGHNLYTYTGPYEYNTVIQHNGVSYWISEDYYPLSNLSVNRLTGGIKRHDFLNESNPHDRANGEPSGTNKEKFDEIKDMIIVPTSRPNRNGWSGYYMVCGPDGTWVEADRHSTDFSAVGSMYTATEAEWEAYYTKHDLSSVTPASSLGAKEQKAVADYLRMHNIPGEVNPSDNYHWDNETIIILKEGNGTGYIEYTSQTQDCETGSEHVYYKDSDFTFYPKFVVPEGGTIPPPPMGCIDPTYAAANPTLCPPTTCPPGDPTCAPPPTIGGCPQTDPTCHPETETGCPNAPAPGENCTPDSSRDGDKTVFETTPRTYAELKDGSVYNEKWDAMAGVPTTQNLYYGIGGNEYMVKVELELVREETAERDYTRGRLHNISIFSDGNT